MLDERKVWQIGGGGAGRSYADLFVRHGVALLGPGDAGPWTADRPDEHFEGGFIRCFASDVALGDVFLLRNGCSRIEAVGLVAGDYEYLSQFDEVNGWDLQHGRRVRWFRLPPGGHELGRTTFGANPRRFSRVWSGEVLDYVNRFLNSPPTDWQTALLPALPELESPLAEIPAELQDLVAQAHDFCAMPWSAFGEVPSEDEFIVHFVAPFFRALGWRPEHIAVKWHDIDVALFSCLPRAPASCHLVVEAKRWNSGVEGALGQAIGYVRALGVPRDVVVTDGIRYRMYASDQGFAPLAYANLSRLKQSATLLFHRLRPP